MTFNNIHSFLPSEYPGLCLLETDIIEPELLARKIAEDVSDHNPSFFQGKEPLVYFKMRYTPPYEKFQEIRRLILQVRQAAGIRSSFQGLVFIDASEYKGHEEEEFFTIFLKYLYDNSRKDALVIVCSQYSEHDIKQLKDICVRFFPVRNEELFLYQEKLLRDMVYKACQTQGITASPEAVSLMTKVLLVPELMPYRSLQLIERIPREIDYYAGVLDPKSRQSSGISAEIVLSYCSDSGSSICMLAGKTLLTERKLDVDRTL